MAFETLTENIEYLTGWRVVGNSCSVYKNGKQVYTHASGYSDKENGIKATGKETLYLYSVSKVITCALAMTLYERGILKLDAPISDVLPEWKAPMVRITENEKESFVPAERPVTVRHLFTMSAGLTYDRDTPQILGAYERTGGRLPTREISRALAQTPLAFQPGTAWRYSLCHDLLAAYCEELIGERFGDYAKRTFFDPLGLEKTSYGVKAGINDDIEPLYKFDYDADAAALNGTQRNTYILGSEYDCGGAGVISTRDEVAKLMDAFACGGVSSDGVRIIGENTLKLMRENQIADIRPTWLWEQYAHYNYGLGVYTLEDGAALGVPNAPKNIFGWCGAAGSHVIIDMENRLSLVYTEHMLNSQEAEFLRLMREGLYADENKGLLF